MILSLALGFDHILTEKMIIFSWGMCEFLQQTAFESRKEYCPGIVRKKTLKMKKKLLLVWILSFCLLLSACGESGGSDTAVSAPSAESAASLAPDAQAEGVSTTASADSSDFFSSRDFEVGYDESSSALIALNGSSASCDSDAVSVSGSTVTIGDEGTYILSGTLNNGMIIIDAEKTDKLQLVLDGVSIHSETSAPLYVRQADKVFITLADGTENTLSNGGGFAAIDENNIDGVIFSKDDLTLNGSGSLIVTSPAGHGIVSKESLTVTSGNYTVSAASHALEGKDDICVANAEFILSSGKDALHAENGDDTALGFIYIQSGSFTIQAEGDGLSAASELRIDGGSFTITTGGGSVNGAKSSSDAWGAFSGGSMGGGMAGGKHQSGGRGGAPMDTMPQPEGESPAEPTEAEDDSTSLKGLKAGGELTINGGDFSIDSADDAFHSNTSLTVNGGSFTIASGDDGFHADETLTINAGTILINESYEGLEGQNVVVAGGEISLTASDDGVNAAGGTDSSGMGGRGGDKFGGMGAMGGTGSSASITISGGSLYVNASGDGLDSNGTLTISGGYTVVCGPTQGDTSTLDYETSGVITGGTFIGTGASGMAQTFSSSEQGVIAVSVGSCAAGTAITLTDASENAVISYSPELSFAVVILSSPDIVKGQTYTITVGSASGSFEAN